MTNLIDDYLRQVETTLRVDGDRKRQIVDELRIHLTEKVDDLQRAAPDRPRADVEQEVLREFGSARDLALAYEPEGTVLLTNSTGDVVLRMGRAVGRGAAAVGRGTGKVLKWTAIALAGMIVVALGVGAWAYYEVKPYLPAIVEQNDPVYQYFERCAKTPCSGAVPADSFYVRDDAKSVKFSLYVYSVHPTERDWDTHVGNGTVTLKVADAAGETRFERSFNATNEGSTSYDTSWAAVPGNWTIAYTFNGFVGAMDVQVYAIGFPWNQDAR